MIVVGGGCVALEQAQLFAHLGTTVTVLARSQLARREEPEIAAAIRDAFAAEGIGVVDGVDVTRTARGRRPQRRARRRVQVLEGDAI